MQLLKLFGYLADHTVLKLCQGQIIIFSSNLRLPPNMSEPGKYKQLYKGV